MESIRFSKKSAANNDFTAALNLTLATGSLKPLEDLHRCFFPSVEDAPLQNKLSEVSVPSIGYLAARDSAREIQKKPKSCKQKIFVYDSTNKNYREKWKAYNNQ